MSDNGVRTALRTLGFDKDVICPHGFRAMGRTILEERLKYRSVLIEPGLTTLIRLWQKSLLNESLSLRPYLSRVAQIIRGGEGFHVLFQ